MAVNSPLDRCNSPDRRDFLGFLTSALAGSAFAQSALAQTGSTVTATKLVDGFFLLTGAGTNVVAVTSSEGVLMVDSGAPEHSSDVLKVVAAQAGGKPVKTLFTTHWHPDHTGANEAVGKAGAKIISHAFTKQWMSTEIDWGWQHQTFEPAPKAALPTETFYDGVNKMTFGTEAVQYAHMPQAHTDGDLYVYFPGPNILVAGDVVSAGSYPVLDWTTNGWIRGMANAQKMLLQIANDSTKIIPGSGPVQTKADLQALNDMCSAGADRILKLMKMGMGPKECVAAKPMADYDAKYGDSELFVLNGYRGLWGHVRELGGIV